MSDTNPTVEDRWTQICLYVKEVTGREVIKAGKDRTPQLNTPYIAVMLLETHPEDHDQYDLVDTNPADSNAPLEQTIRGMCDMTFKFTAIGKNAQQSLDRLRASYQSDLFVWFAAQYGIGILDMGTVTNIAAVLLDAHYENRAELKSSFNTTTPVTFCIPFYTHLDVTVEAINQGDAEYSQTTVAPEGWKPTP